MIQRKLQSIIEAQMFKGKAIIIYGPRRSGKTTLSKQIAKNYDHSYYSCDDPEIVRALKPASAEKLLNFLGKKKLIILDEAQKVRDIGTVIKIIVDAYPEMQIIATGSSSLDLANKTKEPLTGRTREYVLLPLSISETASSGIEGSRQMLRALKYGGYPAINSMTDAEAQNEISLIAEQYIFKDTFDLVEINNKVALTGLLKLIAYQTGNELSLNEIAAQLEIGRATVERYLYLLEQAFVIFHLGSYSNNLRNELKNARKYYFWDLGIRNALVKNFDDIDLRSDKGALFENFCIAERQKQNQHQDGYFRPGVYFWRQYAGSEVDYLEEYGGGIKAFEIKWKDGKSRGLKQLKDKYPDAETKMITSQNVFNEFIELSQ
jgi:uncharacterized protein